MIINRRNNLLCLAFMQEIGRAGKDGLPCSSTVLFNASHISSNVREMSEAMKHYCRSADCRRSLLAYYFGYEYEVFQCRRACCDNCMAKCACSECAILVNDNVRTDNEIALCSGIDNCMKVDEKLVETIKCLFNTINDEYSCFSKCSLKPELYTGLCDSLATLIAQNALKYVSSQTISNDFPFISLSVCERIFSCLHEYK